MVVRQIEVIFVNVIACLFILKLFLQLHETLALQPR